MQTELNPLIAEAALCLWEACIDASNPEWRNDRPAEIKAAAELVDQYRDGWGAYEMRHIMIRLAPDCETVWQSLTDSERDQVQFDWDFCPAFVLAGLNWSDDPATSGGVILWPDALERVRAFLKLEALDRTGMNFVPSN
ncbi:hypothetical protein HAP47_0022745 [Bradyrhizobium sp. 41S5]|uniref:hypothetical protein n=1 Tax=Bradyrhizobium sp. 41S5 TaxID=1404443 RepID=UPI00156ACC28|nr:hypothetical protein [Bradyrhizobium sp. 41S5]UFX42082.1 hypothetical protein HAP47_0022745 [Bradyrhizobium sp. 41S5]